MKHALTLLTPIICQTQPEDFESILSGLVDNIEKRETRLSEIRLRERRVTLLVTLYTVGFWVTYVSVWYTNPGILPIITGYDRSNTLEKFVKGSPVALGPIL
jgi:endoplasmic reticulum junction formation protein lunapark